ncbi:MAG: MFS transporter [Candidatus Aminicenantes bacterium]|nr:MFS transporter [Candidatus Aminicenantes bacterium]
MTELISPLPETGPTPPSLLARLNGLRRRMSWRQAFTALRHPNYRLWFRGQIISLFGTWMQTTALAFLVYELTRSPAYLGLVGFAMGIPSWLFMLYAGVIADRVPRRNLMVVTQTAMMALAFLMALLTFTHLVRPWHILVITFALGIANAFDAPARQAFVLEMVPPQDMTNAIALNSAMFNTATALGPAVGGVIYALLGPAWCFTVNGASFIAVIVALRLMKLPPFEPRPRTNSTLTDLKEGLRYVITQAQVRTIILGIGVLTMFGISFATLLPAWAVQVMGGDAKTNGFLLSARGLGALTGSLLIASLGRFHFRGRLLTFGMFSLPLLVIAFGLVRWLPLSLVLLFGAGLAHILAFNLSNALVQTFAPDALRGRIMSVYSLTFFGLMPLGALGIGATAEKFGAPAAVFVGASVTLVAAALIAVFQPGLRRQS